MPFGDNSFDIVINRHGNFDVKELFRILKPGGIFVTQQVGAENDRELVNLLLPDTALPFPEQYLEKAAKKFTDIGFQILHWYGLLELLSGNFRDFLWKAVLKICTRRNKYWTKRAP